VAAEWELVGGAISLAELEPQIQAWTPHVIVLDAALGLAAVDLATRLLSTGRIVTVGQAPGISGDVPWLGNVRSAILGVPRQPASPAQ
jgi:hypothetical protein